MHLKINDPILDVVIKAATAGGDVCKKFFAQDLKFENKDVSNLVTEADIQAEQAIVEVIRREFPTHDILAEENHTASTSSKHLWVVDPLDGTNNFAHQIPHFAVSIGYWRDGIPQAGVILNPIRDELYYAKSGAGAFGQGAYLSGERLVTNSETALDQSLVGCGFYYDRGEMMRATLRAVESCFERNIHGIRRFGTASLDLIHVASGKYGAFFEYRLAPWDFAAGRLFIEEAGGKITTCRGEVLGLNQSTILASNGHLHEELLELVQKFHP